MLCSQVAVQQVDCKRASESAKVVVACGLFSIDVFDHKQQPDAVSSVKFCDFDMSSLHQEVSSLSMNEACSSPGSGLLMTRNESNFSSPSLSMTQESGDVQGQRLFRRSCTGKSHDTGPHQPAVPSGSHHCLPPVETSHPASSQHLMLCRVSRAQVTICNTLYIGWTSCC